MSANDEIVKLDVGGVIFKTSKPTLTKFDGFFKTMFESEDKLKEDENGCVFIDRDPKHFRLILNFMRDEDVVLPESLKEIQEILKEAKNYELDGLVKICIEKVPTESAAKPKFRLIESDVQMMQIVTNPEKPVLIIHYRMENWETATRYFSISNFQKKYEQYFDIYFKIATSIGDTKWSYSIHDKAPNIFSTPKSCQENNFYWSLENSINRFFQLRQ
ncbi:hypothetical protein GCK72_011179 [Caenorhabditis remanei]|uniref:BTB domain-containing protein n=1 Tax=Caenorhabditis remanei TaxID=31234 RepID=A0A6A5H731_CAERE|nr:hypothetical protein GCK72_011179 [Caenorhabditis remanei]KAF1762915.1 hypothetical protein GCK72_011179 [Caenorhabditis remanei]